MTVLQVMFIVISLITLIGAVYTVLVRNLFHAALGLIVALAGVAAMYALMEASFLAAAQVLIYIGAIAILDHLCGDGDARRDGQVPAC